MIMQQFLSWLLKTFNTIFFSCTAQPRKKEVESGAQNGGKVDSKEISSKDVANISTHGDGMNKTGGHQQLKRNNVLTTEEEEE